MTPPDGAAPRAFLARLARDERGTTLVEYGLILALISLAMIMAFTSLGLNLADVFNTIADTLAAATG